MVGPTDPRLRQLIRNVPDFPKRGIMFRDITTLLGDERAFRSVIDIFYDHYKTKNIRKIVCVESRGFLFGSALAYRLGAGIVPVRKPGKLPSTTLKETYHLEYGSDALEVHSDAIQPGENVLVLDDLLATGGTISAACSLVKRLKGAIVGVAFLIELTFLHGRDKLKEFEVFSIISYDAE